MITDHDLLKLAVKLCLCNTEAEWRNACSRAYFAAFHCARTLLLAMGFEVPRGDQSHGFLWRRMESCGSTSIGKAGSLLVELRRYRNRADYDLITDFSRRDAKYAVESADDVVRILNQLTPDERLAATESIRIYERDILREVTWRQRPR